jgi:hypothetical protein
MICDRLPIASREQGFHVAVVCHLAELVRGT